MNVAVIGTSRKEYEKRVAIHPKHIKTIPEAVRNHLFFEKGYGLSFGMTDGEIADLTGNRLLERKSLFRKFSAIMIPKPVKEDFEEMQEGTLVWGWIHTVQQSEIAQISINKKLTLIAWENMYYSGARSRTHIFQKNNEMAGYCGVQHALQLRGIDGNFGAPRKAVVLSFGSVSRGAVYALRGHGFTDITVFTQRPDFLVSDKIPGVRYRQMTRNEKGKFEVTAANGQSEPIIHELAQADIIVNGVLQNPNSPAVFVRDGDVVQFKKECLIVDISCDRGMGFSFAHPTDLSHPFYRLGNILYYSVDHTPALMWDSASWEISSCLIPYLKDFMEQTKNAVLDGAVDIKNGIIMNKDILAFQNRSPIYPYQRMGLGTQREQEYQKSM